MENLKFILKEYEKIIINLSEDNKLEKNLKKYDQCKLLLSDAVLEKIIVVPNTVDNFMKMMNSLFSFDDLAVAEIFEHI